MAALAQALLIGPLECAVGLERLVASAGASAHARTDRGTDAGVVCGCPDRRAGCRAEECADPRTFGGPLGRATRHADRQLPALRLVLAEPPGVRIAVRVDRRR